MSLRADIVRQRRNSLGWTQEDLAGKVGTITRAQVSRIETGDNQPSPMVLSKLSSLLGIPVDESYALTGYLEGYSKVLFVKPQVGGTIHSL